MEYYHYINIFETKGLEYILVIIFMITFVLFVRNLDAPKKKSGGSETKSQIPNLGETIVVVDRHPESDQPSRS